MDMGYFQCLFCRFLSLFDRAQEVPGKVRLRYGVFPVRNTAAMFRMFFRPVSVGMLRDAAGIWQNAARFRQVPAGYEG